MCALLDRSDHRQLIGIPAVATPRPGRSSLLAQLTDRGAEVGLDAVGLLGPAITIAYASRP